MDDVPTLDLGLKEHIAASQTRAEPTPALNTWQLGLADWLGPGDKDETSQSLVTEAPSEKG